MDGEPPARRTIQPWLVAGGVLSAAASLLHLAILAGGGGWYRFFGAGERMAHMAERGHWYPPVAAACIAGMLALWAAYAFAGAGLLRRLPLMGPALLAITAIYLLRGLALAPIAALWPALLTPFTIWSSLIVLVYGIVHAVGTWRAWPGLSQRNKAHAVGS